MFTEEGRDAFFNLTYIAWAAGLITEAEAAERFEVLLGAGYQEGEQFGEPPQEGQNDRGGEAGCYAGTPHAPILEFKLRPETGLSDWVFTIGDPDPLPSIPHGHWRSPESPIKLDPYRGWISRGANETGKRLKMAEVAAFWNDDDFRNDARSAIIHALMNLPNAKRTLDERGIVRPLRLPAKGQKVKRPSKRKVRPRG